MTHRCKYKILGTGFLNDGFIQVDLFCEKCGKSGVVYVPDVYKKKIIKQASKGKRFRVGKDIVFTTREYEAILNMRGEE